MASLTKRDLIIEVTNKMSHKELTQVLITEIVDSIIEVISGQLSSGETVIIRNFGAFHVKETKSKIGRNPKNPKADVIIPARAIVKFKPGKELKNKVAKTLPKIREKK
jgi:nucleoid DNA-binding protein